MGRPLKVLLAEDNAADAELIVRHLRRAGFDPTWTRVDSREDFLRALPDRPDIILCDYGMAQFNGLEALTLLKNGGWQIPFLLISGTIGEETAVEAMRMGALDYLLKDRLSRLGGAVTQALERGRLDGERQQAVEELRLFRTLVDQSTDAFEVLDLPTGRFVDFNECECRDLGYSREELLKMTVFDVDPMAGPAQWQEFARRLRVEGQVTGEGVHRRKDGSTFPMEYNARLVRLDRDYVVAVVRNITEQRAAVAALRESEERFRQMAENIDEVFWMTDTTKNRMLYISPAYERIWGRAREELFAEPRLWLESIVPEDRDRVLHAATTKQVTGEYREEYRIQRPDGTQRWILDRAFPIRDSGGAVYRVVGVAEDVTARKQLEEQFFRAQRLEAVGTLAGGVAHDLNNILAPVMMITGLLKMRLTEAEDRKALEMLEAAAQRGAAIVRQLLTFSRGAAGQRVAVQLKHLVKEMVSLMRETFPSEIRIIDRCPGDLWPVSGDPTQLHQVLMNLCVNARDAMPGGGDLTLDAGNTELTAVEARAHRGARPGRHVVMTVSDTGDGISAGNLTRIFDPFFTTKEQGKGTGLGLSTVLGIVESHGGFVAVTSQPSVGTTFRVYLPATAGMEVPPPAPPNDAAPRGRGETILVVDDEAHIRETTRQLLEAHGYRVLEAVNGQEGAECFARNQSTVRLVLTDIMMPVQGGTALVRSARTLKPGVPIVVATGFGQKDRMAELTALGVTDILRKPFTGVEVLRLLREVLDRQGSPD